MTMGNKIINAAGSSYKHYISAAATGCMSTNFNNKKVR